MEAKCCEHAIQVTQERVAEALKPVLVTLDVNKKKEVVKALVALGPAFASLIDLL